MRNDKYFKNKLSKEAFFDMLNVEGGDLYYLESRYGNAIGKAPERYAQLKNQLMEEAWNDYLQIVHLYESYHFENNTLNLEDNEFPFDLPITAENINLPRLVYNEPLDALEVFGTQLTVKISNSEVKEAIELVHAGADINKYALSFGTNPLLLSIIKGWNHEDTDGKKEFQKDIILQLLEEKNLHINAVFLGNGMTALHIACLRGDDPQLIKMLLEKGADLNLRDFQGNLPEDYLKLSYKEAKSVFDPLVFHCEFGFRGEAENKCYLATLPTVEEREKNVEAIQLLSRKAADYFKPVESDAQHHTSTHSSEEQPRRIYLPPLKRGGIRVEAL